MSVLIDRLKKEQGDSRSAEEITYDLGQQLEAIGNKEVFAANKDFFDEYLEIKRSLRPGLGSEMWKALSASFRDTVPESLYNAGAAIRGLQARHPFGPMLPFVGGTSDTKEDAATQWFEKKAAQEAAEYEAHRGEVSVPSIDDVHNLSDLVRYGAVGAAEALPQMAPMVAGGAAVQGGKLAARLAAAGLPARTAQTAAGIVGAAGPATLQQTGEIYGNLPEEVRGTEAASMAALGGGALAGSLDAFGALAGPIGRLITRGGPTRTIVQAAMEKAGAEGIYNGVVNVLERGGLKGVAAKFAQGAITEAPTEVAQEAVAIAAEEFATGQELPEEIVSARLRNALAGGAAVGGILGGAAGYRADPSIEVQRAREAAFDSTVLSPSEDPAGILPGESPFPGMPVTGMANIPQSERDIIAPPLDETYTGEIEPLNAKQGLSANAGLTPDEALALSALDVPGPLQFQTDDEIDLESLANQALNAAKGAAKVLAPPADAFPEFGQDYVAQKKQTGVVPVLEGGPKLPDKFDISVPLLGEGNEIYAADAPNALSPLRGLEDAQRFGEIRSPEEVAQFIAEQTISNKRPVIKPEVVKGPKPKIKAEVVADATPAEPAVEGEVDDAVTMAPYVTPGHRIEGGGPLIGRIYSPEDGGNDAKIEAAVRGSKGTADQSGARKAVALLDRATGQVLLRGIKPDKARVGGIRKAAIVIDGMMKLRKRKPVIDPTYATTGAPWDLIREEKFRGLQRYEVIGEFAWDTPRNSVIVNFKDIEDFNKHEELSGAVNQYFTRGVYSDEETKQRIARMFPRQTETRLPRAELEKARGAMKPKEFYELLIAHKHKLTGEDLVQASKDLSVKEVAKLAAASKAIKTERAKQITGGGSVDVGTEASKQGRIVSLDNETGAGAEARAALDSAADETPTEDEIEAAKKTNVDPRFGNEVMRIKALMLSKGSVKDIDSLVDQLTIKLLQQKGITSGQNVDPKLLRDLLKKKIEGVQFSMRSPTAWLMDRSQADAQLKKFVEAMQAAGADVVALQQDIDSAYEALRDKYGFALTDATRGRPIIGLVGDWVSNPKPEANTVLNAAHEAAHLFIDTVLAPEQKQAFQGAVHMMEDSGKYMINPFTTDLRILANTPRENLTPQQLAIVENSTMQEVQEALSISPDQLVTERMVEHLTFFGIDSNEGRGLVQQMIRFLKDISYRVALAIQKALKGGETSNDLVQKFVENRWLQFINRDFASSNSALALSLRKAIGAPTVVQERMPLYMNLDGDSVNLDGSEIVGDDAQAVMDRIRSALDRWNAEHGVNPESIRLQPIIAQRDAIAKQLQEKYAATMSTPNFQADPNDEPLFKRLSQLDYAISTLGHFGEDRKRVLERAKKEGEGVQFSQRRVAESLNPEIEANTQLATINHQGEVFSNLYNHPDVMRFLPAGTTLDEFQRQYLSVGPLSSPEQKRNALIEEIKASVNPVSNQPFGYNPGATIASLPTSAEGSSPQQTAIRDGLIQLNRIQSRIERRLESSVERHAELNARNNNLTTSERAEYLKLGSRIPMLERVLTLKDYGIRDQVQRLEDKIGKSFLWKAEPGAEYLVPEQRDSDEASVRGSKAKIPNSLSFDSNSRTQFYSNIRKQNEWLKNPDNKKNGELYHTIKEQNRKLQEMSAEPIYTAQTWRMRNTYFDSLRNMLRGIGTPIAKFMGSRFDNFDAFLLRWGNQRTVAGGKWSSAYADFKKSMKWKTSDDEFRTRYWNKIAHLLEDVPTGTADPAGQVIGAFKTISKITLSPEQQSALRTLIRETLASNAQEREMFTDSGNKVQDEKLGKGAQRDQVQQGVFTGRRTTSEAIDRIVQEMDPVWATDTDQLFKGTEEQYNLDQNKVKVTATKYFTPQIVNNFVRPFIYNNRQYFTAPQAEGATKRLANLSSVREAFEAARGDIVEFAKNLNRIEGGNAATEGKMVESVLSTFNNYYLKFGRIANAREAANQAAVETLPRQIMDAREASDLPPEFVNYALYDTGSNRTLLFQIGLNSAFGRNGLSTGEFASNMKQTYRELEAMHTELSTLIINEGKTKEEAKKIMGADRYIIATQAPDHMRLLDRFTDKMSMITRSSGSLMADIRIADELLGLNASMNLQNPRSALINVMDVLSPLYKTKLSAQSIEAVKTAAVTTFKDITGSLFEAFNIHLYTQSETNRRMQELGLHDSELYLNWRDKLTDYGPPNALDEPAGVETLGSKVKRNTLLGVRRLRQITNVGVADVADMAALKKLGINLPLNPGDKNIAPKLRLLGIFNVVGQSLANGAIDGQYKNFKDLVTRGVDYIKKSANPEVAARKLFDGQMKFTPEDLGYTQKWMFFNDRPAYDYMTVAIAEKLNEGSLERMVAEAYIRTKFDSEADVITDKQFVRIAHLALTEFQLNSNFSNSPIDLKSNSLWRLLSPYLTWPYLAMLRFPGLFKDANGRLTARAALDGAATTLIGVVPMTMAASMMFDLFDEEVLGKRSNLRDADLEDAIPGVGIVNKPMATLERLGRYGGGGLFVEALNSALNMDDARGGFTADNRILLFSQMKNFKDIITNLWQMGVGNANYAGVMRPLAQFMGLGGILQYQQITNKRLGLNNEESAVNERINIANYLRAAGRDLDLDVRVMRGPSSLPNEVTPYLQNMELAVYMDDIVAFRSAFRRAVEQYHQLHPDEPDAAKQVIRSFQTRHPLKRVFSTLPSEKNYRNILNDLNPTGRAAVTDGVRVFNKYLLLLGSKPIEAKEETNVIDDMQRRLVSNEAIREAQALAAQAAYYGR